MPLARHQDSGPGPFDRFTNRNMSVRYRTVAGTGTGDDEIKYAEHIEERQYPRSRTKLRLAIFVHLFLSLLWLAPIITLLYFNFSGRVIGASLWCPSHNCLFNPFATDSFALANKYNHEAHNLLGVLQLVAKALEVWFVFVSSGLVYLAANWLASRPSGLPLTYYASHVEFSDLRILLDPEFWGAARAIDRRNGERSSRRSSWLLYVFVLFIASICVLTNLMGPAVAVLILPSIRQLQTPTVPEKVFDRMESDSPPAGDSTIPYCKGEDLKQTNYNCTWYSYGNSLDAWVASGRAFDNQIPYVVSRWPNGTNPASNLFDSSQALFAVSQEWAVSFAFNASSDDNVFWAPNRQMLRNLTADLENFFEATKGIQDDFSPEALLKNQDPILNALIGDDDKGFMPAPPDHTFGQLNDSLQTVLQRNGPIIGAEVNFYQASSWTATEVADDRFVLCSHGWSPLAAADPNWNSTKCMALGAGWPGGRAWNVTGEYELTIPQLPVNVLSDNVSEISLTFEMFWANQATYFNSTSENNEIANQLIKDGCLPDGQLSKSAKCDWDSFFEQTPPDSAYPSILQNVHTILVEITGLNTTNDIDRFVIEFSPHMTMAQYSLDTSPYSNAVRLVQTSGLPQNVHDAGVEDIYIHPSWLLAMFSGFPNNDTSIRDEGNFTSPYTATYSTTAIEIAQTLSYIATWFNGSHDLYAKTKSTDENDVDAIQQYRSLFYTTYLTTLHLCSMLSFSTTEFVDASPPPQYPAVVLSRGASIQVWAYGLDTRTSILGAVVVLSGVAVVLLYVVLGIVMRVRVRSMTELLAAALRHQSRGGDDFAECQGDESKTGRVRFTTGKIGNGEMDFEKVL